MRLLEEFDGMAGLRNGLRKVAELRGDFAGIPMPLSGRRLVVEPNYPKAKELAAIGAPDEEDESDAGRRIRNTFWSIKKRGDIVIFEEDGRVDWGLHPGVHHFGMDLATLDCADAWGIEQEHNAVQTLGTLIRHRQFKQYLLTGMFMETSKRSGVAYVFRRLKPTVAIRVGEAGSRILCTLCLHPIAYYAGSWAGAMTPTDDVVAHLMLMRGDEKMFWRRSNQHAPWRPEAGL